MIQGWICFLNDLYCIHFWCLLDFIIRKVINYMDYTCFVFVNACALWWLKLDPQVVSSSTLGTVSRTHVDTPSRSESLGGGSLLNIRRDSARMHGLSSRQADTKNHLSSRVEG
jgi:hypothetical protein